MKRLAFWIIVGVAVLHITRRHHSQPRAWATDGPPHAHERVRLVSNDGPPPPPKASRKVAPRAKTAPAPPVPAPSAPKPDPKRAPEWWPRDVAEEEAHARTGDVRVLIGQLSATEEKARQDLLAKARAAVSDWLVGDVPRAWDPGTREVQAILRSTYIQPVAESLDSAAKDLEDTYILYRAGAQADFSPGRRARLVALYNDEVVRHRMLQGGGVLSFALIALAALSGYIRADEATKGYYTNRLRLLAAAGVGAAGVAAYHLLA